MINPNNEATTTTSKLEWNIPAYQLKTDKPYRVEVDESSDFADPFRDYSTNNTNYTPQLTDGKWYWRVLARDINETSSDWSEVRSFILNSSLQSTSPSPNQTSSNNSSTTTTNAFTFSGSPSSIKSTEGFSVSIQLSQVNTPNTKYFLKGAFYQDGQSNYFGQTKVSGSWVKNSQSATSQFPIVTDNNGSWSGNIELMPDMEDSGYKGSGSYKIKIGRYNSSGDNLTWSNDSSINIEGVATPTPTATSKSSPTPKPSATIKPNTTPLTSNKNSSSMEAILLSNNTAEVNEHQIPDLSSSNNSNILGASSINKTKVPKKTGINWFFIAASIIIAILSGYYGYKYYQKRKTLNGI